MDFGEICGKISACFPSSRELVDRAARLYARGEPGDRVEARRILLNQVVAPEYHRIHAYERSVGYAAETEFLSTVKKSLLRENARDSRTQLAESWQRSTKDLKTIVSSVRLLTIIKPVWDKIEGLIPEKYRWGGRVVLWLVKPGKFLYDAARGKNGAREAIRNFGAARIDQAKELAARTSKVVKKGVAKGVETVRTVTHAAWQGVKKTGQAIQGGARRVWNLLFCR